MKLRDRWTWGPYVARPCPRCGCTPERPCSMQLPDGVSEARCVPAGAYGFRACSRCLAGMPLAGELATAAIAVELADAAKLTGSGRT